jgi:ParB family chromosome partitioning protein
MEQKVIKKKNALGRGLGALLQDSEVVGSPQHEELQALSSINELPIEYIETNPFQPRLDFDQEALHELADSIRIQGIIQPITVRQLSLNQYQLISGERRLQASKLAGLKTIPAYIRHADDQQMLEMALIENIQRENLNAVEIALSYQRLITECNLKQEELGERVGKNRATVNNYIRLLRLPPQIQKALRDNRLSMGHARALINIESVEEKLEIFRRIMEEDLSVRKVEEMVRNLGNESLHNKKVKNAQKPPIKFEFIQLQSQLSTHFGTKVEVKSQNNQKGEIKIPFASEEDLSRILELLQL